MQTPSNFQSDERNHGGSIPLHISRPRNKEHFSSVQGLRAVAAFAVVLFHLRSVEERRLPGTTLLDPWVAHADAGVDLFFVISGFVMTTIIRSLPAGGASAIRFLVARAWRILPLYWVFTTVVLGLMIATPDWVNSAFPDQSIVASYFLIPHHQLPLLTVGWTLIHEAFFYLVFALAIAFVPAHLLTHFLIGWASLISIHHWIGMPTISATHAVLSSPLTLEFIAGALLGLHWRRAPQHSGGFLLIVGLIVFAFSAPLLSEAREPAVRHWLRATLFGTAGALIVWGAVKLEKDATFKTPEWLAALGDASYSLYLSHIFVISAAGRAWGRVLPQDSAMNHVAFLVCALGASLLTAHLVHRTIERPLLDFPRRLSLRHPQG